MDKYTFAHLLHNYETASHSVRTAKDPEERKWLEGVRDNLKAQLQAASAGMPNPELGDTQATEPTPPPPAALQRYPELGVAPTQEVAKPAPTPDASFIEPLPGNYTGNAPASAGSGHLTDAEREGIRKFAPGGVLPASFSGSSVAPKPPADQPTTAEQPQGGGVPLPSIEDLMSLGGKGGGGGGSSLRAAQRGAAAAGAESAAATAAQKQAVTARADQAALNANMEGATVAGFLDQLRSSNDDYQARSDEARKRANQALDESTKATQDFKVAMADKGLSSLVSGGNIGAAISLALGAFGAGLQGQSGNPALTVLMARVNADLNERAHRAQVAGAHADMLDRLYRRNLDALGDIEAAKNATRAGLLDQMKLEVARQSTVAGGEDKQAAAKEVNATLDAEIARSHEAAANQALLAATKRAGKGKSQLELMKEAAGVQKLIIENQTNANKLNESGSGSDLGSVEGQRAANRKEKIQQALAPFDTTLEYGTLLMNKGVPSVVTRAKAASGAPLTALENEQMSALSTLTRNMLKAIEQGRLSDQDAEAAKKELVRQGPTVSQEALTNQIQNLMNIAKRSKLKIMAGDIPASSAYEADKKRLGVNSPEPPSFTPAGATQIGG